MSCSMANKSGKAVVKSKAQKASVDCALRDGNSEAKVNSMFKQAVQKYRTAMTVNIDYANEYLTRARESNLGTLAFFIVDDLLDTLNMDATRVLFEAESGFKLKKIKDADTIRVMYHLAENVKLLDTVAEKTLAWYKRKQCQMNVDMEEVVWNIWDQMNLSEYIRMYKEMYECMPGDESRLFYESTSLHTLLHHCHPDRIAQIIEYTVSSEPQPICSNTSGCKLNSAKQISSSNLRQAAQSSARNRRSKSLNQSGADCSMRSR